MIQAFKRHMGIFDMAFDLLQRGVGGEGTILSTFILEMEVEKRMMVKASLSALYRRSDTLDIED